MNKMGEENGNERYLVNVSKLEKLMEEKRNEQNVKRIRALFKNSDIGIDVRAEDTLDTAYSTYTTIISKKSATKKTLQLLADYLKRSSFKELVAEDNSMIEREEEREDVISNVTEHMEGLDPKIVNMLSEFSEQLYPMRDFIQVASGETGMKNDMNLSFMCLGNIGIKDIVQR